MSQLIYFEKSKNTFSRRLENCENPPVEKTYDDSFNTEWMTFHRGALKNFF